MLLWVIAGAALLPGMLSWVMLRDGAAKHHQPLSGTINPNAAAWWELSLLPEIGETTARKIVQFRLDADRDDESPAFRQASDLAMIRGIGPKTVTKIAPYLKFE